MQSEYERGAEAMRKAVKDFLLHRGRLHQDLRDPALCAECDGIFRVVSSLPTPPAADAEVSAPDPEDAALDALVVGAMKADPIAEAITVGACYAGGCLPNVDECWFVERASGERGYEWLSAYGWKTEKGWTTNPHHAMRYCEHQARRTAQELTKLGAGDLFVTAHGFAPMPPAADAAPKPDAVALLAQACAVIEGLEDQQAMPDDWYTERLGAFRAFLATEQAEREGGGDA